MAEKFEQVVKPSQRVLRCCATCKHSKRFVRTHGTSTDDGNCGVDVSALCCNIDSDDVDDLLDDDFIDWVREHSVNKLGDCDAYEVDLGVV